jgi:hypothetical protein
MSDLFKPKWTVNSTLEQALMAKSKRRKRRIREGLRNISKVWGYK